MDSESYVEQAIETNSISEVPPEKTNDVLISLGLRYQEALFINDLKLADKLSKLIEDITKVVPVPERREKPKLSSENKKKLSQKTSKKAEPRLTKTSTVPRRTKKAAKKNDEDNESENGQISTPTKNQQKNVESPRKYNELQEEDLNRYNEIIEKMLYNEGKGQKDTSCVDELNKEEKQELMTTISARKKESLENDDMKTAKAIDNITDYLRATSNTPEGRISRRLEELKAKRQDLKDKIQANKEEFEEEMEKLDESYQTAKDYFDEEIKAMEYECDQKNNKYRENHRINVFREVEELKDMHKRLLAVRDYEAAKNTKRKYTDLEEELIQKEDERLDEVCERRMDLLQVNINKKTEGFNQRWDSQYYQLQCRMEASLEQYKSILSAVDSQIKFYETKLKETKAKHQNK